MPALADRPATRRNGFHATTTTMAPVSMPDPDPTPNAAEIFDALAEPWPDSMIYTRPGEHGKTFAYVTWPMVARRLDEVLGPDGWETDLTPLPPVVLRSDSGDMLAAPFAVKCALSIMLPDGRRLTRASIGEGRSCKAADTDAGKRAARLFGVAAYLYDDDAAEHPGHGQHASPAEPATRHGHASSPSPASEPPPAPLPRDGRQLYRWSMDRLERGEKTGTTKHFSQFGDLKGWPNRLTAWTPEMVAAALAEMGLA